MNQPIDLTYGAGGGGTESCCDSHPDWPTLTEHLMVDFPAMGLEQVVKAVAEAKTSTDGMDLPGREALRTGEILARIRLDERMEAAGLPARETRRRR